MKWRISCQELAERVSESFDRDLSWFEKSSLHFHFWICKGCKMYEQQLIAMQAFFKKLAENASELSSTETLSEEAKSKIKQSILSSIKPSQ